MLAVSVLLFTPALLFCPIAESAVLTCEAEEKDHWSYHGSKNGPSAWGETYPNCYGEQQSPVAIDTDEVVTDRKLRPLRMKNYGKPITEARIVNNGHSIQIIPQDDVARTIKAEASTYTFQQLHFHWGSDYYIGSEHTIDDETYALEAHFVHKDAKDNIAVVGVLYQSVPENSTAFDPLFQVLPGIQFKGKSVSLESPLYLDYLLPDNPSSFYRYRGSLTTPGCDEGVVWSILEGVEKIGEDQLNMLRNLYSAKEDENYAACPLKDNFRPEQPLNGRVIYASM